MAYTTRRWLGRGHNATVDVSRACTYFPPALAREPKLITADRPMRPEATARQRDAPSGAKVLASSSCVRGEAEGKNVRQSFRTFECGPRPADPARGAVGSRRRCGAAGSAAGADRGRRRARCRPRLHRRSQEARRRGCGHQVGHARPDGREDRARSARRYIGLRGPADRPQCAGAGRHHDGGTARLGQNHDHGESRQAPCRDAKAQSADGFARHPPAGGDGAARGARPPGQCRYLAGCRRPDAGADREPRAAGGAARRL